MYFTFCKMSCSHHLFSSAHNYKLHFIFVLKTFFEILYILKFVKVLFSYYGSAYSFHLDEKFWT